MKIFLTGASGFLGSHLVEELIRANHRVRAFIRQTSRIDHLQSLNLEYIEGSFPHTQDLETSLEGCDAIVHSAGLVKAFTKKDFFEVNEQGTQCLVDAVLKCKNGPKIFIYISTIAVHDSSKDGSDFCLPFPKCHPLTAYGKSKLAGEKALESLRGKARIYILRPPVLYGPRDKEFFPIFKAVQWGLAPLYGLGKNRLSLCYVTDVAQAVVELLEKQPPCDEIFCLDDGAIYNWKDIVNTISQVMDKKIILFPTPPLLYQLAAVFSQAVSKLFGKPIAFTLEKVREMDQSNWVCGYRKLSETTGWKPKIKLLEGAAKTLEFYRKEGFIH